MKTLLALLTLLTVVSCATVDPKAGLKYDPYFHAVMSDELIYYQDEYGIIHTNRPTTWEYYTGIQVSHSPDIQPGCKRLRAFYYDDKVVNNTKNGYAWFGSKMQATHVEVMSGLPKGLFGGIAWNCWDKHKRLKETRLKLLALNRLNGLRKAKGQKPLSMESFSKPKKNGLPVIVIGQGF
jgi:hypothetical protein